MEKLRFGIIGPGKIARKFLNAVRMTDEAEVVAVASRSPERAKTFADKFSVPFVCDTYEELVARTDVDAVYIATTHNFHYENLLLCLNAGKHVLCEKAMVLEKVQAETVFSMAKDKGLFCMEAMWSRFLPAIQKAKSWIDQGRLGRVELASCIVGFLADQDPEGRILNPKLAGGALYDIGVYAIEITDYLVPEPLLEVIPLLTWTEQGVDKTNNLTLRYDNCIANLQVLISGGTASSLDIYGTEGRIHIDTPVTCDSCELYDNKGLLEKFYCRQDNGFVYEIQEMLSCIREGRLESAVMPYRDTIQCAAIFDQCMGTK